MKGMIISIIIAIVIVMVGFKILSKYSDEAYKKYEQEQGIRPAAKK